MKNPDRGARYLPGDRLRFVVSTGRTGTVTIAEYLRRLAPERVHAAHEP